MAKQPDWSEAETAFLRAAATTLKMTDVAEQLGRPLSAVKSKIYRDRIAWQRKAQGEGWTPEEIDALRALAPTGVTIAKAAKKLGRSEAATRTKAADLRISFRAAKTGENNVRRRQMRERERLAGMSGKRVQGMTKIQYVEFHVANFLDFLEYRRGGQG